MRNRHKFTFIFCSILSDFFAIIGGIFLFFNFTEEASVQWNIFVVENSYLFAVVGWLVAALYFNLYRLDTIFSLTTFYRNSWRVFLSQCILWQIYLLVFQGASEYRMAIGANLLQFSYLLFYLLSHQKYSLKYLRNFDCNILFFLLNLLPISPNSYS